MNGWMLTSPFSHRTHLQLRQINTSSFPISYNEEFYKNVSKQKNEEMSKFAYWNGYVVGAVCTRVEPVREGAEEQRLYIMTLAVLAAYRGRGIGKQLLKSILEYTETNKSIAEISLHVHVENQDAIKFYTDKFNFKQGEMIENYYRRVDPPHCYRLYKELNGGSALEEETPV
jgi:ribosomal protein S18 acetylase RimI-like enzyme